jgi:hypothetical protein
MIKIIAAHPGTFAVIRTPVKGDKGGAYRTRREVVIAWEIDIDEDDSAGAPGWVQAIGVNGRIQGAYDIEHAEVS